MVAARDFAGLGGHRVPVKLDTQYFVGGSPTVKLAMGALSFKARLRLIWFVLTGQMVTFSGEVVINTQFATATQVLPPPPGFGD